MSTAMASLPQETNQFRYGIPGTDYSSTKEPEIRARSAKQQFDVAINPNKAKEELKLCWSGVVISANDQDLTVRVEDLLNRDNPDELIVLSRDEIDDKDQCLVKPGALFYWNIGYRQGFKCPKERFSIIRFRRLPKWTDKEIKDAENLAEEYADFFLSD